MNTSTKKNSLSKLPMEYGHHTSLTRKSTVTHVSESFDDRRSCEDRLEDSLKFA